MQLATAPRSPSKPPPLWFVTNGDVVVGPVSTNQLLRGVSHERIPDTCLVRGSGWSRWRALSQIREVSALSRREAVRGRARLPKATWAEVVGRRARGVARLERLMGAATDPGEVLLFALNELMTATGAVVGLVHRVRAPYVGYVTSVARGPGARSLLGLVVPCRDPGVTLAGEGAVVSGEASSSVALRAAADRLGATSAAAGVLVAPVACGSSLYALLELGRSDHTFRAIDRETATSVTRAATDRLANIRN